MWASGPYSSFTEEETEMGRPAAGGSVQLGLGAGSLAHTWFSRA